MNFRIFFIVLCCLVTFSKAVEYFRSDSGIEYFVSYPLRKNWHKAQRFCAYYGLHLISVHSFEEEQTILSIINQFKTKHNLSNAITFDVYTSGSDLGHLTNDFYWTTTGHPFIYTNWIKDYPTNLQPSNCVTFNERANWKWENLNCAYEYYFMCQNRITTPEVNRTNEIIKCQIE